MSHYSSIKTAWSESFGMQEPLSPNARERTHEASIDNMANEESLLFDIWDLLKVLISLSLLKLFSALATVSRQFSIIRSAINTLG